MPIITEKLKNIYYYLKIMIGSIFNIELVQGIVLIKCFAAPESNAWILTWGLVFKSTIYGW